MKDMVKQIMAFESGELDEDSVSDRATKGGSKMTRLRFYVGLHGPHQELVSHKSGQNYLIRVYGAYTATPADGAWQGTREPSVVYEVLSERPVMRAEAAEDAAHLRDLCRQQSVLYTVETCVPGGFV